MYLLGMYRVLSRGYFPGYFPGTLQERGAASTEERYLVVREPASSGANEAPWDQAIVACPGEQDRASDLRRQ
jgi:hypothetical protein